MFIRATGGYDEDGAQWAEGLFLVLALPKTRFKSWYALRDALRQRCEDECRKNGRELWFWKDYLSPEEKAEGYGEVLYHPPFDLLRAAVRETRLTQLGHYMAGFTKIQGLRVHLSGTYGGDGLPKDLPRPVWDSMVPLPKEIIALAKQGGGHNSPGAEGPSLRQWALDNVDKLLEAGT